MNARSWTTVFSKRPVPGRVKTRLVPPLDPGQAARLAQAMLDDALARHAESADQRVVLAVDPPQAIGWFEARYPRVDEVVAQEGEGLGERLARWFERALAEASTVVVLGADCPLLARRVVTAAHARLAAGADAVFAPDTGGGYALVGLSRPAPELFRGVPVSVEDNLDLTLDRAAQSRLSVELLPDQRDVDVEADLLALVRELNTRREAGRLGADFPAHTDAVLQELLLGSSA